MSQHRGYQKGFEGGSEMNATTSAVPEQGSGHGKASQNSQHHSHSHFGSKTERYRRERNEAENQLVILQQELDKSAQLLAAHKNAVNESKESATRVRLAMQDKELFIGPQALDPQIQIAYKGLFKGVRTLSRFLEVEDIDPATFTPEMRAQFNRIAPRLDDFGLKRLLANKSTRRYLFEGWIGHIMVEKLFVALPDGPYPGNDAQDLWLEPRQASDLQNLERSLQNTFIPPRDFNDWRAYSASLLSKSRGNNDLPISTETCARDLCHSIMGTVENWIYGPQNGQKMALELLNVIGEAVNFSRLLRVQRAQWSLRFPVQNTTISSEDYNDQNSLQRKSFVLFDSHTMKSQEPHDDDEPTDNKYVQIFITPVLFKRGDADGNKFDVFSPIERSVILWGEENFHKNLPPPPPEKEPQASRPEPPARKYTKDRIEQHHETTRPEPPARIYTKDRVEQHHEANRPECSARGYPKNRIEEHPEDLLPNKVQDNVERQYVEGSKD